MINEDYCTYEVAKLLKEKGFDVKTLTVYSQNGSFMPNGVIEDTYQTFYNAPTHQMAMKWLREREKLAYNILIIADGDLGDLHYSYEIQEIDNEFLQVNGSLDIEDQRFDTYEEAVEAALKYSLENLI